jgi:acetyl-CoA synthetase
MLERYLTKTEFSSYEEFYRDFDIKVPEGFNFAFDVVDEWAKKDQDRKSVV